MPRGNLSPKAMRRIWAKESKRTRDQQRRRAEEQKVFEAGQQKRKEQEDEHKRRRLESQKAKYRFATAPRTASRPVAEAANSPERLERAANQ